MASLPLFSFFLRSKINLLISKHDHYFLLTVNKICAILHLELNVIQLLTFNTEQFLNLPDSFSEIPISISLIIKDQLIINLLACLFFESWILANNKWFQNAPFRVLLHPLTIIITPSYSL